MKLTQNLPMKFLSLLVGLGLWFFVAYEVDKDVRKEVETSLEFHGLPDDLTVISPKDLRVKVVYITKARLENRVSSSEVRVWVDASTLKGPGVKEKLTIHASAPLGKVTTISPQVVEVVVDKLARREEPVLITLTGEPGKGKDLGRVTLSPSKVLVLGPISLMPRLSHLQITLEAQRFAHNAFTLADPVLVGVPANQRDLFKLEPETVTVNAEVVEIATSKDLPVSPEINGSPSPGFRLESVEVTPTHVHITGPILTLEHLHFVETAPLYLDKSPGDISKSLTLSLPLGVMAEPPEVSVLVKITPLWPPKELTLDLGPGYSPRRVRLMVYGAPWQVADVGPEDFQTHLEYDKDNLMRVKVTPKGELPILMARLLDLQVLRVTRKDIP